eukprot:m.82458 g.82458  ORF g.82458 m.82458 type:complete len:232 (+) comp50777_c0_seq1:69-764(+)
MFTQDDVVELCSAAANNQLGKCQDIVRACGVEVIITIHKDSASGRTALHWVAYKNKPEILAWFLQHVDCNARDGDGETALIWAISDHNTECVQVLLEAGADTASRSKSGANALALARESNYMDIVALIEAHDGRLAAQQNIKPALRESLHHVEQVQSAEDTATESGHNLLQDEQPAPADESLLSESATALAEIGEGLTASQMAKEDGSGQTCTSLPVMNLGLTDQDFALEE